MFKARAITEGAILVALFTILMLISIYVPFAGMFSMLVLAIPFIVYTYRHPFKNAITFFFVALAITYIVSGVLGLPMTFAFGTAGLAMGYVYVKGKSAFSILITGSITFIIDLLLLYGISVAVLQINPVEQSKEMFMQSMQNAEGILKGMGQEPSAQLDQMYEALDLIVYILPSIVIMSGIALALITQIFSNLVLKRLRVGKILTFPPFREWRFPKSLLWYYLGVMLLSFMNSEEGSTLYILVINAFLVLQLIMVIQGLALVYYYSYVKGWKKFIPILTTVLAFFIPLLLYIIEFLGIIDLGFDLRKRIKHES